MPENEDKIKKLYDTFVSDGYDMRVKKISARTYRILQNARQLMML